QCTEYIQRPETAPSSAGVKIEQETKTGLINKVKEQWNFLPPETLMSNDSLTTRQVLLLKTTASEYGAIPPMVVPCSGSGGANLFKTLTCGSFQDTYLNTAIDRSRV
uniref:Uncharacterized protein n=1 Tax=Strigops habroptila TaxID=2489341 RepID=A0A672V8H7_STRHB